MAPVRYLPGGTSTRPPPSLAQSAIALLIAALLSVVPSPRAPKSVILNSRAGNCGARTLFAMSAARAQASSEEILTEERQTDATDKAAPTPATKWRRVEWIIGPSNRMAP